MSHRCIRSFPCQVWLEDATVQNHKSRSRFKKNSKTNFKNSIVFQFVSLHFKTKMHLKSWNIRIRKLIFTWKLQTFSSFKSNLKKKISKHRFDNKIKPEQLEVVSIKPDLSEARLNFNYQLFCHFLFNQFIFSGITDLWLFRNVSILFIMDLFLQEHCCIQWQL